MSKEREHEILGAIARDVDTPELRRALSDFEHGSENIPAPIPETSPSIRQELSDILPGNRFTRIGIRLGSAALIVSSVALLAGEWNAAENELYCSNATQEVAVTPGMNVYEVYDKAEAAVDNPTNSDNIRFAVINYLSATQDDKFVADKSNNGVGPAVVNFGVSSISIPLRCEPKQQS